MTKILPLFKTEYDLAKAIKQGNKAAQNEFYSKYSSRMLGICMRYVSDKMQAEDVMIDGFMRVFDKIDQFGFNGSFEGWVKRIMVNEALMYLRSKKMIEIDIELVSDQSFHFPLDTSLEADDLISVINQLPVGYKTVFNLYAIEGYSHAEIADKLGISEGTSKSQLSRARTMLQEKLSYLKMNNLGN